MAIAHVQSQRQAQSGGTSFTLSAYSSSVTAGNLLTLGICLSMTGGSITSVTDTQGNTWAAASTLANADSAGVSGNPRVQIWYAVAGSTGSCAPTINYSGTATYCTVVNSEYSGCATSSVLDGSGASVNNGNVNTGATPTILSTSLTTGQANSLIVAVIGVNNAVGVGTGYTNRASGGGWAYDYVEDKLDAGAAGSVTVSFNDAVGLNDNYAISAAAFKILGGGGVSTTNYYPGSDITTSGWTSSESGNLYITISETTPSDSEYDQSAVNPSTDVMEVKFANVQTPSANTNHTVSYRIKGDNSTNMVVSLVCNTTIIKTWTHSPAPSSYTTYDQTLSTGEANTISDYSNLRLRVTAG